MNDRCIRNIQGNNLDIKKQVVSMVHSFRIGSIGITVTRYTYKYFYIGIILAETNVSGLYLEL